MFHFSESENENDSFQVGIRHFPLSLFQNVEHKTFETPQTPVSLSLSLASEEN